MKATFTMQRTTPGTVVYKEDGPADQHKVGSLYLQKRNFPTGHYPAQVTVTIEAITASVAKVEDL